MDQWIPPGTSSIITSIQTMLSGQLFISVVNYISILNQISTQSGYSTQGLAPELSNAACIDIINICHKIQLLSIERSNITYFKEYI